MGEGGSASRPVVASAIVRSAAVREGLGSCLVASGTAPPATAIPGTQLERLAVRSNGYRDVCTLGGYEHFPEPVALPERDRLIEDDA